MPGIDELDYFYSFGDHNFTIAQVNEDSIILRDNNVDSTDREEFWKFGYSIGQNGEFIAIRWKSRQLVSGIVSMLGTDVESWMITLEKPERGSL